MEGRTVTRLAAAPVLVMVAFSFLAEDKPDYGDSTLKYYVSRSDRIVVVKVLSEDVVGQVTDSGQVIYDLKVIVQDAIKGRDKKGDEVRIEAIRWDAGESQDAMPVLKKGTSLILFLSNDNRTADQRFGIQPFNSWMVRRLRGIVPQKPEADPNKPNARGR